MRLGLLRCVALAGALLASGGSVWAKDCGTVSRGKELKQMVAQSNVLVALRKDESETKELCERLQQTPEARIQDLEIVTVEDHNLQRKVWDSSRPAPVSLLDRIWWAVESRVPFLKQIRGPSSTTTSTTTSVETPAFVLFVKGDSYENAEGVRYSGEDLSADAVSTFLAMWLKTKKLGSFVYSLGTYDLIAAQTMQWVQDYGTQGLLPRLWVHGVGRVTGYLIQPASMPFEAQLAQMYISAAMKVLQHGPDYPKTQIDRLERMLNDEDAKISPLKREELSQRMFVWRKYSEPMEVSKEDFYKFVGRLCLNVLSVVALVVMIPMLLFTTEEQEEEEEENPKEEEQGEESNGDAANGDEHEPTDVDSSDPTTTDTTAMTKEGKRAAAILRAKQAMEEDKKKVEAVKAKKQQGTSSSDQGSNTIYSRDELIGLTVLQLREILKERDLKVSGNKAELVARILGEE